MQRAKLFAYVNNNIDIKRILQDKQFHLEQKEIIQNVLERKDSMAVLPTGFGKSMCYVVSTTNICMVNHRRLLRQNN
jgi:superfamily II DNA helicase RecQ